MLHFAVAFHERLHISQKQKQKQELNQSSERKHLGRQHRLRDESRSILLRNAGMVVKELAKGFRDHPRTFPRNGFLALSEPVQCIRSNDSSVNGSSATPISLPVRRAGMKSAIPFQPPWPRLFLSNAKC